MEPTGPHLHIRNQEFEPPRLGPEVEPCRSADDLCKPCPLKSALLKKLDASAKKPNYFPMGLYGMRPFARLNKPRPALT